MKKIPYLRINSNKLLKFIIPIIIFIKNIIKLKLYKSNGM